jgi:hypothetical protein
LADLAAILASIAGTLDAVSPGLKTVDYYADNLEPGVGGLLEIGPVSGQGQTNGQHSGQTGDGMDYLITAQLYLSTVAEESAQKRMYALMSRGNALSVWDTLEAANAVAGVYEKLRVLRMHSYDNVERSGGGRLLTNSWDIVVTAS